MEMECQTVTSWCTTEASSGNFVTVREWWWLVEPFVASLSFAMFINIYWFQERKRGLSRDNNFWTTVNLCSMGDLYNSLVAYWIGIFVLRIIQYFAIVIFNRLPRMTLVTMKVKSSSVPLSLLQSMDHRHHDTIPTDFNGMCYLISEVVTGIILYDASFFFIHWMLHEVSWIKQWHHRHHHHQPGASLLEARDVLRHSLVDGILQVGCNIIVQQYHISVVFSSLKLTFKPKTRIARVVHNIVVPWMLTESHTSSPAPWVWRRFFVGVREHRYHHLRYHRQHHDNGERNITIERHQQFFGYLDEIRHGLSKMLTLSHGPLSFPYLFTYVSRNIGSEYSLELQLGHPLK
jgi:hypothetical protein